MNRQESHTSSIGNFKDNSSMLLPGDMMNRVQLSNESMVLYPPANSILMNSNAAADGAYYFRADGTAINESEYFEGMEGDQQGGQVYEGEGEYPRQQPSLPNIQHLVADEVYIWIPTKLIAGNKEYKTGASVTKSGEAASARIAKPRGEWHSRKLVAQLMSDGRGFLKVAKHSGLERYNLLISDIHSVLKFVIGPENPLKHTALSDGTVEYINGSIGLKIEAAGDILLSFAFPTILMRDQWHEALTNAICTFERSEIIAAGKKEESSQQHEENQDSVQLAREQAERNLLNGSQSQVDEFAELQQRDSCLIILAEEERALAKERQMQSRDESTNAGGLSERPTTKEFVEFFLSHDGTANATQKALSLECPPNNGVIRIKHRDKQKYTTWLLRADVKNYPQQKVIYLRKLSKSKIRAPFEKFLNMVPPEWIQGRYSHPLDLHLTSIRVMKPWTPIMFLEQVHKKKSMGLELYCETLDTRVKWQEWFVFAGISHVDCPEELNLLDEGDDDDEVDTCTTFEGADVKAEGGGTPHHTTGEAGKPLTRSSSFGGMTFRGGKRLPPKRRSSKATVSTPVEQQVSLEAADEVMTQLQREQEEQFGQLMQEADEEDAQSIHSNDGPLEIATAKLLSSPREVSVRGASQSPIKETTLFASMEEEPATRPRSDTKPSKAVTTSDKTKPAGKSTPSQDRNADTWYNRPLAMHEERTSLTPSANEKAASRNSTKSWYALDKQRRHEAAMKSATPTASAISKLDMQMATHSAESADLILNRSSPIARGGQTPIKRSTNSSPVPQSAMSSGKASPIRQNSSSFLGTPEPLLDAKGEEVNTAAVEQFFSKYDRDMQTSPMLTPKPTVERQSLGMMTERMTPPTLDEQRARLRAQLQYNDVQCQSSLRSTPTTAIGKVEAPPMQVSSSSTQWSRPTTPNAKGSFHQQTQQSPERLSRASSPIVFLGGTNSPDGSRRVPYQHQPIQDYRCEIGNGGFEDASSILANSHHRRKTELEWSHVRSAKDIDNSVDFSSQHHVPTPEAMLCEIGEDPAFLKHNNFVRASEAFSFGFRGVGGLSPQQLPRQSQQQQGNFVGGFYPQNTDGNVNDGHHGTSQDAPSWISSFKREHVSADILNAQQRQLPLARRPHACQLGHLTKSNQRGLNRLSYRSAEKVKQQNNFDATRQDHGTLLETGRAYPIQSPTHPSAQTQPPKSSFTVDTPSSPITAENLQRLNQMSRMSVNGREEASVLSSSIVYHHNGNKSVVMMEPTGQRKSSSLIPPQQLRPSSHSRSPTVRSPVERRATDSVIVNTTRRHSNEGSNDVESNLFIAKHAFTKPNKTASSSRSSVSPAANRHHRAQTLEVTSQRVGGQQQIYPSSSRHYYADSNAAVEAVGGDETLTNFTSVSHQEPAPPKGVHICPICSGDKATMPRCAVTNRPHVIRSL